MTRCLGTQLCPNGACLYNIFKDPEEQENLSGNASLAETLKEMASVPCHLKTILLSPLFYLYIHISFFLDVTELIIKTLHLYTYLVE